MCRKLSFVQLYSLDLIYFAFFVISGVLNSIFLRPTVLDCIWSIFHAVLCVLKPVVKGQNSMLKLRAQVEGSSSRLHLKAQVEGSDSRLKLKAHAQGSSSKLKLNA